MDTAESRYRQDGSARQQFTFNRFLSLARTEVYDRLKVIRMALWKEAADDMLTPDQAAYVEEIFEARLKGETKREVTQAPRRPESNVGSRPITPESLQRRRVLASEGWLTPDDRKMLTQGHAALASKVLEEITFRGACELHVDALAAMAGIGRRWTQLGLRLLEQLGLIAVEIRPAERRRHDTNRITLHPSRIELYGRRLKARKHWWRGRSRTPKLPKTGRILHRTTRHRGQNSVALTGDTIAQGAVFAGPGAPGRERARSGPSRPGREAPG